MLNADGSADNCGVYEENEPVAEPSTGSAGASPAASPTATPATVGSPFYSLYGIERAGRLTGQRFLGGHDWYRVGCEYLVEHPEGGRLLEGGRGGTQQLDHWPVVATSFSLLFLSKGRTPVLMTKLAHGDGDDWNNKHNDMRHLVEFASRELFKKQPLAWQVFDVRKKPAERPTAAATWRPSC